MNSDDPQENSSPPTEQRQPDEHTDSAKTQITPRVTELESPIARNKCRESCKANKHWLDYATFVIEILGLLGLAIYAFLTYGIWCANKKIAKDTHQSVVNADRSFKVDERAWVAPIITAIRSEPAKKGNGTIFVVPFSNTGKTFALHVHAWINRTANPNQVGDDRNDPAAPWILLAPGGVGNTSTADFPIAPSDVQSIKNGLRVYVYGTIWYRDIFRKDQRDHWTQFCIYPGPDLKSFGPCDRHNEADETDNEQK
jgi:hypothetical protein